MSFELSKQEKVKEILKCGKDPSYFLNNYARISHPLHGLILFNTFDFQDDLLKDFNDYRFNVILKARQLGISTITAGYIVWMMLFPRDKAILVMATKFATAGNLVKKVKNIMRNVPDWLKIAQISVDNRTSFELSNGSSIKAASTSGDAGRSEALSLLVLDEAAHIDGLEELWTGLYPTLSTGGRCIALSTPNGVGNWFHRTWADAEAGTNKFNFIKLHWTVHPDRDESWRREQDGLLGPSLAAQECDCDFITSGQSVVDGVLLEECRNTTVREPMEKRGIDSNIWIWEPPNYTKDYIVCADVSRGDGQDYSAFHIIDVEKVEQVGEYKGKVSPKDFGNMLVNISTEYNNALLIIENASIGWAAIQQCIDRQYDNLFYMSKDLQYVDTLNTINNKINRSERQMVPGFSMTMKTRPLVISKLEEFFREKSVIVHSNRLIDELFVFIYNGQKAEAMGGYNDDLVMSLAIGLWVRETALRLRQEGIELTKKSLSYFSSNEGVYSNNTNQNDSWNMNVGKETEKLDWLL